MLDLRLFRQSILFAISLLSVQGTIYLLQFVSAAAMAPADYSVVRIIESIAAIGAQLATFGLPSVALVRIGIAPTDPLRRRLIRRCLTIVLGFGALAALAYVIAVQFGFLRGQTDGHTTAIVGLSALMAFRLLLMAVTQSRQHYARLAGMALVSCGLAAATYMGFHLSGGDRIVGWLAARCVLEGSLCLGLVLTELGPLAIRSPDQAPGRTSGLKAAGMAGLLALSLPIGGSLIARSIVDNAPILWLASIGVDAAVIARFGITITIITVALVLGGIVQGVAVPRLAHDLERGDHRGGYALLFAGLGVVTAIGFVALVVVSHFVLPWGRLLAWDIVIPGCVIVVAKMSASAMGGYLLVANRGNLIFGLNSITVVIGVLAAAGLVIFHVPLTLPLLLVVLGSIEAIAAICYGFASASVRVPPPAPTPIHPAQPL